MSSRIGVVPKRRVAAAIVFALVFCLCGVFAAAQVTIQPKDEFFGGYSWLGVSGYADFNVRVQDINAGFDASNTWYFPAIHNLGIVVDGSGHFDTGGPGYTGIGFAMGGL